MMHRAIELHKGDVLYCNTKFMEEYGYYYELMPGEIIYIHSSPNSILNEGIMFRVVKIFKEKSPNKKWWQFWIKQTEKVTGYHIEVMEDKNE